MRDPRLILSGLLIAALLLQAALPRVRLLIVTCAAGLSCLAATLLRVGSVQEIFALVPWDVLIILVGLGLLSELLVTSRLFDLLAVASCRLSGSDPRRVILAFAVGMYLVSGLVNNLTALLLVLPVLLNLLKLMGVHQRYTTWTLGILLVACNLGGAATPIGDFPAILLLGKGSMTFSAYLVAAAPPTALALCLLLGVGLLVVRPERDMGQSALASRLSLAVISSLYRGVRLDRRRLLPLLAILTGMIGLWLFLPASTGVTPELICWMGVGLALLCFPRQGERLLRTRVDFEAVLFLLGLFVMVGAVRRTGVFSEAARLLTGLPVSPAAQFVAFLLLSGLLTGVFSAGPSMAALLEVAQVLAQHLPPTAVYVGLALSVCAGSSLFLTAATSGPMIQTLTERALLRDMKGERILFGFVDFVPVGLLAFALIQSVAVGYALLRAGVFG